jgi:hypothetical protein
VKRLFLLACVVAAPAFAQIYDGVLSNGRVMDPESGLDAIRNVGINGARIAAISDAVRRDLSGAARRPGPRALPFLTAPYNCISVPIHFN